MLAGEHPRSTLKWSPHAGLKCLPGLGGQGGSGEPPKGPRGPQLNCEWLLDHLGVHLLMDAQECSLILPWKVCALLALCALCTAHILPPGGVKMNCCERGCPCV